MKTIHRSLLIASFIVPFAVTAASAMSHSEWEAYKKDCRSRGGTPGVHMDGSPGCHIGAAAKVKNGFKLNKSPKLVKGSGSGKAAFTDLVGTK
ncbi:hypothetical protein [Cohaesibacter intestini]|uniref:hypothetical protein n=1 Tax=Cohaesibacter intestini TaxID=2211145 RepID=UPI000DE92155|nr:hypothetical protein [Cohaesibacter intestini]